MEKKKLSSDKTHFIKKVFPVIISLLFVGFVTYLIVEELYILFPILLFFLIGLIITFVRNRKIVDCYVNYDTYEIMLDNLSGKIMLYKFSELISARHKQSRSEVRLKFIDGKSFVFISRNTWKSPLVEKWDNVDADLDKILANRFTKTIS
jgi:hypothetical protein